MNAKQLTLGYQYSKEKDENNRISLSKDNGVYFIKGFVNNVHIYDAFETFKDAKKAYNNIKF